MSYTEAELKSLEEGIHEIKYCEVRVALSLIEEVRRLREALADISEGWTCPSRRDKHGNIIAPPECRAIADAALAI